MRNHFLSLLLLLSVLTSGFTQSESAEVLIKVKTLADIQKRNSQVESNFKDFKTGKLYENINHLKASPDVRVNQLSLTWTYYVGIIYMGMNELTAITGDQSYRDFSINRYNTFFQNKDYFERQCALGLDEGTYGWGGMCLFFRMSILDDCGAMSGGLLEVLNDLNKTEENEAKRYVNEVSNFVLNKNMRMTDGTFCRDWPYNPTVWADDLYMACTFRIRMWEFSGDEKYLNEALKQCDQLFSLLYNPDKGLCHHFYDGSNERKSPAYWGRANGWLAFAMCDVLRKVPESNPMKAVLVEKLAVFLEGLSGYQSANGLWNQLLNKEDSYEELSATSMFVYAYSHAIRLGWISSNYLPIVQNAWKGMGKYWSEDGAFKQVCVGTNASYSLSDYYTRPTQDNDAHGTGPLLLSGLAYYRLLKSLEK